MTHAADLELVLDDFLGAGPNTMPDGLFEAVLDRVELSPQSRRARLALGPAALRPDTRMVALLTAGALVVGAVAAGVGARPQGTDPQPTPLPSVSATPIAGPPGGQIVLAPESLRNHRWLATPRDLSEHGIESEIAGLGFRMAGLQYETGRTVILRSDVVMDGPNELVLTSIENPGGCQVGDHGRYRFALSGAETRLTLTLIGDDCASRAAALPGSYQRSGCEPYWAWCLGDVAAGNLVSFLFDPDGPLEPGPPFRPGALTYRVPDGWANPFDVPSAYALAPQGTWPSTPSFDEGWDAAAASIAVLARPEAPADPCAATPASGGGRSDLVAWLRGLASVTVETERDVTIGGRAATVLDLAVEASRLVGCDDTTLLQESSVGGPFWTLRAAAAGERLRLVVIDIGADRAVVVAIRHRDPVALDGFVAKAMPIVESFVIED